MYGKFLGLFLLFFYTALFSQGDQKAMQSGNPQSLVEFFTKGSVYGNLRYDFMGTYNENELLDYTTHAAGVYLGYKTAALHNFSLGVEGAYVTEIYGNDLLKVDPLTGKSANWESEMYDYLDPQNRDHLFRLSQLYIQYKHKSVLARFGKLDIDQGPLFLKRDGRMNPFLYQGLWIDVFQKFNTNFHFGWINGVAPRGSIKWFTLENAIGLNNNGIVPDGQKADYYQQTPIKGIGVVGIDKKFGTHLNVKLWNYFYHRIMNTVWIESEYKLNNLKLGVQFAHQNPLKFQESLAYNNRYIQPDERANVVSTQVGYVINDMEFSASYLHSFSGGRFLFPRELGREDFYVSQPRAWIDGFGNSNVYMLRWKYKPSFVKNSSVDLRLSKIESPGLDHLEFNKYKLRSFYQSTLLIRKRMSGKLDGLSFELLYIARIQAKNQTIEISEKPYKYNFDHFNFRTEVTF